MSAAEIISAPVSRRREDWPRRLGEFLRERNGVAFTWGAQDCCLFVCDGIERITGIDPAAEIFRGQYRGALAALRLVRTHGGVEAIAEKICAAHGFEVEAVRFARRGDVLLADMERHGPALGLCEGRYGVFAGPAGLARVPVENCRRAWRID